MSGVFRFLTAGESHGEALVAVIDGVPAGLPLAEGDINEGAFLEEFSGDGIEEIRHNYLAYLASPKTW